VTNTTAIQIEIVVHSPLTFRHVELTIFAKFVCNIIDGGAGGFRSLFVVVVGRAGVVLLGVGVRRLVVGMGWGLVVGFGWWFVGTGFFTEPFPVMGVDGMCKRLHVRMVCRFTLLTHDVFDSFHKSGVIMVSEDTIILTCLNS
jgi:hypothetical protein